MLRKYQKVEEASVLSPEEHAKVEEGLQKVGKTSMRDLDDKEREQVTEALDEKDEDEEKPRRSAKK